MNTPRLIKIDTGEAFPLDGGETIIGRADDCSLVVRDDSVSSRHAAIRKSANGIITVLDMGSTNGTTVNNVRISEAQLVSGQRVVFGRVAFQFHNADAAPPPLPPLREPLAVPPARMGLRRFIAGLVVASVALLAVLIVLGAFVSVDTNNGSSALISASSIQRKPLPSFTEDQHALIDGKKVQYPTVDDDLFLVRKLESLYGQLSSVGNGPEGEKILHGLWTEANDALRHIKTHSLDGDTQRLYTDFLLARDAFIALKSEIGSIEANAAAALSNDRMQNSFDSGRTAGDAWAQGENGGMTSGDALIGGALLGFARYIINDRSGELERQKQALHAASFERYQQKIMHLEENQAQLLQNLANRHDWRKGEVGFDRTDQESDQERSAWTNRDIATLERMALDRMKLRPRDPFAVRDYFEVLSQKQITGVTPERWLVLADQAFNASKFIPKDPTFDAERNSFLSTAAWAADCAADTYARGSFVNEVNDLTALSNAYAERLLQTAPKDPFGFGRFYKAKALAHRGDFSHAAETIDEVTPLQPRNPLVFYTIARIRARGGSASEAFASLRSAFGAGWSDIRAVRQSGDFASLRATQAAAFDDLLKVKYQWKPIPGTFTDDVSLTNTSAFALTNITFRVDMKNGTQTSCRMLENLPRLAPGESKIWTGIMSDSATADALVEKLTCAEK